MRTVDYSGAELEQAVIAALYDAFDSASDLTTEALAKTVRRDRAARDHDARDDRADARVGSHPRAWHRRAQVRAKPRAGWRGYGCTDPESRRQVAKTPTDDGRKLAFSSTWEDSQLEVPFHEVMMMTNLAGAQEGARGDGAQVLNEAEQGASVSVRWLSRRQSCRRRCRSTWAAGDIRRRRQREDGTRTISSPTVVGRRDDQRRVWKKSSGEEQRRAQKALSNDHHNVKQACEDR